MGSAYSKNNYEVQNRNLGKVKTCFTLDFYLLVLTIEHDLINLLNGKTSFNSIQCKYIFNFINKYLKNTYEQNVKGANFWHMKSKKYIYIIPESTNYT